VRSNWCHAELDGADFCLFLLPTAKRYIGMTSRVIPDEYIVQLKSGASMDAHATRIFSTSSILSAPGVKEVSDDNVYVGKFTKEQFDSIRSDEDVEYVEPNVIVNATYSCPNQVLTLFLGGCALSFGQGARRIGI